LTLVMSLEHGQQFGHFARAGGLVPLRRWRDERSGLHAVEGLAADWRYSGVLDGAAFSSFAYTPIGDSDGDGMPDWWEEAMGLDPQVSDGDADPDGDGLSNFYEYLAGTDPFRADSNNNGISDYNEDGVDHDGVSNGDEQDIYRTDPSRWDTDDDGISDPDEIASGSNPRDSRSPYVMRALRFTSGGGGTNTVVVSDKINGRNTARLSLPVWTVEMYVNPDILPASGTACPLVSREVERTGKVNYEIGIINGHLYTRFDCLSVNASTPVVGGLPLSTSKWTHVAARYDGKLLTLFVNGERAGSTDISADCAVGPGDLTFGCPGFVGRIMGIRIWKIAQEDAAIKDLAAQNLFYGDVTAMGGYLHVGGGGLVKESATTLASPPIGKPASRSFSRGFHHRHVPGELDTGGMGQDHRRRHNNCPAQ